MAHPTRTEIHDCTCKRNRGHGVHHTYKEHGCGCDPCRDAARFYNKVRRNTPFMAPVGPTQDWLHLLIERGMTAKQAAEHIGRSRWTVEDLLRTNRKWVTVELAEDIRSIPLPPPKERQRCRLKDCRMVHKAMGLCSIHYRRYHRWKQKEIAHDRPGTVEGWMVAVQAQEGV